MVSTGGTHHQVTLVATGRTDTGTIGKLHHLTLSNARQECIIKDPSAWRGCKIDCSTVFCTGGELGKDSCVGDSGSPAVVCSGTEHWLMGILVKGTELPHNGPSCGAKGRHDVYTNVSRYMDLIQYVMQHESAPACNDCHCKVMRNDICQWGSSCTSDQTVTSEAPFGPPLFSKCGFYPSSHQNVPDSNRTRGDVVHTDSTTGNASYSHGNSNRTNDNTTIVNRDPTSKDPSYKNDNNTLNHSHYHRIRNTSVNTNTRNCYDLHMITTQYKGLAVASFVVVCFCIGAVGLSHTGQAHDTIRMHKSKL